MRLLVTRAEADATETAARLEGLGHTVLIEPLLVIEFTPAPRGTFKPGAIIFTSRNAVRAVASWPMAAAWRDTPVYVVGEETGKSAARAGFTDIRIGPGTAEGLSDHVLSTYDRAAGTILYPAAEEVSVDLDAALSAAGIGVLQVEAYRAVPPQELSERAKKALTGGELDGVLLFSRRTAGIFRDLVLKAELAAPAGKLTYFVLSDQVATALPKLGEVTTRSAAEPTVDSLLAAIGPAAPT